MAQDDCTCSVGRELIKGNWKEAVRLLMSGHEGERVDSAAARKLFLEGRGHCRRAQADAPPPDCGARNP